MGGDEGQHALRVGTAVSGDEDLHGGVSFRQRRSIQLDTTSIRRTSAWPSVLLASSPLAPPTFLGLHARIPVALDTVLEVADAFFEVLPPALWPASAHGNHSRCSGCSRCSCGRSRRVPGGRDRARNTCRDRRSPASRHRSGGRPCNCPGSGDAGGRWERCGNSRSGPARPAPGACGRSARASRPCPGWPLQIPPPVATQFPQAGRSDYGFPRRCLS